MPTSTTIEDVIPAVRKERPDLVAALDWLRQTERRNPGHRGACEAARAELEAELIARYGRTE